MRDIIEILERWTGEGAPSPSARSWSASAPPRATRARRSRSRRRREIAGGVTGGCVEPAVIREANEVLERLARPARPLRPRRRGRLRRRPQLRRQDRGCRLPRSTRSSCSPIADAVRADRPIAVTLQPRRGALRRAGDLRSRELATATLVPAAARSLLEIGESAIVESADGELVFVESYAPRPNLYLFGASDHVAALVPLGKQLGYRVTVCDPRKVFLTRERFPDADELSDDWPDQFLARAPIDPRTAIC